jgi:hypothetical protein
MVVVVLTAAQYTQPAFEIFNDTPIVFRAGVTNGTAVVDELVGRTIG